MGGYHPYEKKDLFERYGISIDLSFQPKLIYGQIRNVLKDGKLEMLTLAEAAGEGGPEYSCVSNPSPALIRANHSRKVIPFTGDDLRRRKSG